MTALQTDDAKAFAIITFLSKRGFTIDFVSVKNEIVIDPEPSKANVDKLIANETILVAYLKSLRDRPATNHKFAPLGNMGPELARLSICLPCGIPWFLHGEPPESHWAPVMDLSTVQLRTCSPLYFSEVAA